MRDGDIQLMLGAFLIFVALVAGTSYMTMRLTVVEMRANLEQHRLEVDCGPP